MSEEKNKDRRTMWSVIFGVFILYIVFAFIPFWIAKIDEQLTVNELGDSFGLANAFFSAAAMAGVILTLYFQMKEMKAQREEMHTQNEMLELQREALDEQRKEMIEMQRTQCLSTKLNYLQRDMLSHEEHLEREYLVEFIDRHVWKYAAQNEVLDEQEMLVVLQSKFGPIHFAFYAFLAEVGIFEKSKMLNPNEKGIASLLSDISDALTSYQFTLMRFGDVAGISKSFEERVSKIQSVMMSLLLSLNYLSEEKPEKLESLFGTLSKFGGVITNDEAEFNVRHKDLEQMLVLPPNPFQIT